MNDNEAIVATVRNVAIAVAVCFLAMAGCDSVSRYSDAIETRAAMENGYEQDNSGWGAPVWRKSESIPDEPKPFNEQRYLDSLELPKPKRPAKKQKPDYRRNLTTEEVQEAIEPEPLLIGPS